MKSKQLFGAILVGIAAMFGVATAAPLVGGETTVQVTADLGGLGLNAEPLDDSLFNAESGTFTFPISGGDLEGLAGTIEHEEAGVRLFTETASVSLENFVIDTVNSLINADVTVNDGSPINDAPIFSFDVADLTDINDLFDTANPMLPLRFTATAAMVLADAFDLDVDLAGVEFGLAATAPVVVPVPPAMGLFAGGAAALAWARRRRKAA